MLSDEVLDPARRAATVQRPLEPLPGPLGHREGDHMPEALSFTEIDRQHLELLPARTVMSVFMTVDSLGNGTGGSGGEAGAGGESAATTSTNPAMKVLEAVAAVVPLPPAKGK